MITVLQIPAWLIIIRRFTKRLSDLVLKALVSKERKDNNLSLTDNRYFVYGLRVSNRKAGTGQAY
ncbi:4497_t:CDS:2 [Paraglomus brasilianum]|uniref:4497_t:CDS:1 n=1 Tax=Paraglomus brasilianum TaxID=144538 RepID=A0A9N8W7F0_9GLOM|nr:4497_t:CDS:2 [Paraglomus brasilianum]